MAGQLLPLPTWENRPRLQPDEATEAYEQIVQNIERAFLRFRTVKWSHIKTCLGISKRNYQELKLFWKTVYLLFENFETRRDQKLLPLVANILYFMVFEHFYGCYFLSIRDSPIKISVLSHEFNRAKHNIILKLMKQPYTSHTSIRMPEEDIVWLSVKLDSERMLPILLRQGVGYMPPSSHEAGWEYCKNVLNDICYLDDIFQTFDHRYIIRALKVYTPERRQRIFTLFRAIDVIQHTIQCARRMKVWMGIETERNYIERYRMVFETIPEPIVTLREVIRVLNVVFERVHYKTVKRFCLIFKDLMPESLAPLAPRSLYHLCRCKVRDQVRKAGQFPYGVYKLPIPNAIKGYVLLENWFPCHAARILNKRMVYPDMSTAMDED